MEFLPLLLLLQPALPLRMNCRFEVAGFEEFVGELYTCNVGSIHVEEPNMTLERVDGAHMEGKSSDDVKAISVDSQVLKFIPNGLGETFKNLEALHIQKSELTVIAKEDLQQFPNLKSLAVNDCNLQQLESGLFQFNPKLKVLQLQYNKISFIATDIFEPIKDLEKADLGVNSCISNRAFNHEQLEGLVEDIKRHCQIKLTNKVGSLQPEFITLVVMAVILSSILKFKE